MLNDKALTVNIKIRAPLFIDEYDLEGGYVILVYDFPEEMRGDIEKFKKGKYSQFSNWYRSQETSKFQNYVINKDSEWKVLVEDMYGTILAPEDELWQIVNWEKETLDINNIREI